jgi:hypothetical protein
LYIFKEKSNVILRNNTNNEVSTNKIHHLPFTSEWQNSNFNFNKNISFDTNLKDKLVFYILNSYFNSVPINLYKKKIKRRWMSLNRIFISKPNIKHSINEVIITIYSFNKQKLFLLNKITNINKLFIKKGLYRKYDTKFKNKFKIWEFINKFVFNGLVNNKLINTSNTNVHSFLYNLYMRLSIHKNSNKNLLVNKIVKKVFMKKFRRNYLYKYYTTMLYVNNLKFNMANLVGLTNILNKIYNKKVIINIVSLKYLFLDNYLITDAIIRKLNDRKKRILKVMRRSLKLAKKAKLHPMLLIPKSINVNTINNIQNYKTIIYNYIKDNYSSVFNSLNNKYLTGIRIQGSGRLTKRLTASRSVLKYSHKGTLKNINSSFQRVSTVMLRGYAKSNVQYNNINSKNRNGSFGIKSWSSSF